MPLLPRFVTGRSLLSFKFDREQSADANETHSGTGIALLYVRDYSDIFIVRFDRDQRCFSLELPITMQACHAYPPHWELGEDRGLNLRGTVEPRVSA
jgi:hypothetical protein